MKTTFQKHILLCGCFSFDSLDHGGQPVKTREIYSALVKRYCRNAVSFFETKDWKRKPVSSLLRLLIRIRQNNVLIMMPAQNGLKVFSLVFTISKKIWGKELHYVVIGGWLPCFLGSHPRIRKRMTAFSGIYVETMTMEKSLEAMGLQNVSVMPNCKELRILQEEELAYSVQEPLKLCTFSRVMKEKGIEDAIAAVRDINASYGREVYCLDIYGQVDAAQIEWFEGLKKSFPSCIRYAGVIPYDQSVETIKNYFALLFPTHFFTEGVPGTIIDALAAGVPVISAKWENYADSIEDQITGIGYSFNDFEGFKETLCRLAEDPERIIPMKKACLVKAREYTPENALKPLFQQLEE